MRTLTLAAVLALLAGAAAAESKAADPKPNRPVWGCQVEREPARKIPESEAAKIVPRDGRLYYLDQPYYCHPPKPAPMREPQPNPKRRL